MSDPSMEIVARQEEVKLVHPQTGEIVATPEAAVEVLAWAREARDNLMAFVKAAEAFLVRESEREGTKTLRYGSRTATIGAGVSHVYDAQELERRLREAGLSEERIREAVVEEVSYRVRANVLKQLAGANPVYAKIVEECRTTVEKAPSVGVK